MYWLRLTCPTEAVDRLTGELWGLGTAGIQELKNEGALVLIAHFETAESRNELISRFAIYAPEWGRDEEKDWLHETLAAWPAREVGRRLFLAPSWNTEPTPAGRERVIHNPGLACGTGEHPCSQLALCALERCLLPESTVVDIGTGSGILAIAARRLGARAAVGVDLDVYALEAARQNFELNGLDAQLVAGSADCLAKACADITVTNINASVLLFLLDELMRITRADGRLILTGFTEAESWRFREIFPAGEVSALDEWRCLTVRF